MYPYASPHFIAPVAHGFIAARSIRGPDLYFAAAIAQTFSEVREVPRADYIVGIEVLIKDADAWFAQYVREGMPCKICSLIHAYVFSIP